jgi:hypothetical protein
MTLVGKVEVRPTASLSNSPSYRVLVTRCLLCGEMGEHVCPSPLEGDRVMAMCDCYTPDHLQPVRMIEND